MFPDNFMLQERRNIKPQQKQWSFFAASCPDRSLIEVSSLFPSELDTFPDEIDTNDAVRREMSSLGSSPIPSEDSRPNMNFSLKEQQCYFIDFSKTQPHFLNSTLPKPGQDFIYVNPKLTELYAQPLGETISTNVDFADTEDPTVEVPREIEQATMNEDEEEDNSFENVLNFSELRLLDEDSKPDSSILSQIRFFLDCKPNIEEQNQNIENNQIQIDQCELLTTEFQTLTLSDAKVRSIRNSITQPHFFNPSIKLPLEDVRSMAPLSSPPAIDRSFEFLPDVSCRHINTYHSQPHFYNPKL